MHRSRKFPIIPLLLSLFVPAPAVSQTAILPDSALQAILRDIPGTRLPLSVAIRRATEEATPVRRAEAFLLASEGSVRREAGQFDPVFFFNLDHLDQQQPTASFFAGAPILSTKQTRSSSGLKMTLPIGTQLELSMNTARLATNSTFAFLNPEHDVEGSLNIRQPLLGGLSISARSELTRSEIERDAAQARYDQQVVSAATDAEQLYWDLYAAERNLAVQRLTRDRAEAFLKETELRSRAGLVGPHQVANARTFLAEQELLLIDREEQLDRQSDLLAALIGLRPEGEPARFIPSDDPPTDYPLDTLEALVARALSRNLDLQADSRATDAAQAMADAAAWKALPDVNVVGSLGGHGLGGGNQTVIFGSDTLRTAGGGSFGDAVRQVTGRKYPSWSIGLEISVPIGLRSGSGEHDRLEANVLGARQAFLERSRGVEEQVRSAYREVAHGKRRINAASAGVDATQDQIRIGLIEFRNGRLTAFELVRLGEDAAVAQQRYSEALVRTAKAAASLRRLTSAGYPRISE